MSCGGTPFPASALDDLIPVEDSELPGVRRALEMFLTTDEGTFWPQDGWLVLTADRDVLLVHADADAVSFITFTHTGSAWRWDSSSSNDTCTLRSVMPAGLNLVDWRLDRAFPRPGPDSTEIHVRVTEQDCASGQPMGDRLLGPQIIETSQSVLVAFAAITQPGGQECPANPSTPVTVTLPSPLGNRDLRDGTVVADDIRDLLR